MTGLGGALDRGEWAVRLGEHEVLRTPLWPLGLPFVAGILGIGAALLFVFAAVRGGLGRRGLAILPPLLALVVVGALQSAPRALFAGSDARAVAALLGPLFDAAAAAFGVPLLLAGLAAGGWVAATGGVTNRALVSTGAGSAVAAVLFGSITSVWGAVLFSAGVVPAIAPSVPARMHVGFSVDVPVEAPDWQTTPLRLSAATAGPLVWRTEPHRPLLTVVVDGAVDVGEDRPSPLFPLDSGNTWTLGSSTSWHDQYLWFVSSDHEVPGEACRFGVEDGPAHEGLRIHTVRRVRAGEDARSWAVYGWNGHTYVLDPAAGASVADAEFVAATGAPAASGPPVQACTFEGLPEFSCSCYTRSPGAGVALPGPARCAASHGGGVASALVSGLLAIATLGLVIEDPDRTEVLELTSSGHEVKR